MRPLNHKIIKAISQGTEYLVREQQTNGSFLSLTTTKPDDFTNAKTSHTIVPSNLVLSCLNSLEETHTIQEIKRKVVEFLLSQKSEHWSFNYWVRESEEAKTTPYPDDLDDTFCALAALYQYNPDLIGGEAMAKITTLLTALEEKEGGPYNMWLVPPDTDAAWKRIDLVVNSNIAYFLSLQDISLPNVNTFIEQAIAAEDYIFPYCSIYPAIYFISRFYRGPKVEKVRNFLLSKSASGRWENPLYTALAVSSLLNLGTPPDKLKRSIEFILRSVDEEGWKPYPFYVELKTKEKTYYAGAAVITAALCLEALNKFKMQNSKFKTEVQNSKIDTEETGNTYEEVTKRARQRFLELEGDLKKQALATLEKTLKEDKDKQIVLMPYFFKTALGQSGKGVSEDLLVQLGLANLYGWVAYTIYDDFLDDEGEPKLLSVANVCLRELTAVFTSVLPKEAGFNSFFQQIMDTLDGANTWEASHCRTKILNSKSEAPNKFKIPNYGDFSRLAERSLGHALGPAAILFSLGYNSESPEVKNLMRFFKHFLTARQLNDDAHDWEKDLKMGQINAVGAEVLRKIKDQKSKIKNQKFQEIFWYKVVVDVCKSTLEHVRLARGALKENPIIANPSLFEKILLPIERSAQKALEEREETFEFLKAYGHQPF